MPRREGRSRDSTEEEACQAKNRNLENYLAREKTLQGEVLPRVFCPIGVLHSVGIGHFCIRQTNIKDFCSLSVYEARRVLEALQAREGIYKA